MKEMQHQKSLVSKNQAYQYSSNVRERFLHMTLGLGFILSIRAIGLVVCLESQA